MSLYTDSDYTSQRVRVSRDKSNVSNSNEHNAFTGASSYLGISAPAPLCYRSRPQTIFFPGAIRAAIFILLYDIREVNVLYDYLGYYTLTELWGSM
jgi:hypothetical protein